MVSCATFDCDFRCALPDCIVAQRDAMRESLIRLLNHETAEDRICDLWEQAGGRQQIIQFARLLERDIKGVARGR